MKRVWIAASFVAGLVAASGAKAGPEDVRAPVSLTSFGAAQAISSYRLSAVGLVLAPTHTFSQDAFAASALVLPVSYRDGAPLQSFAASTALNVNLALDAGYNLDLAQRFGGYTVQSPLISGDRFFSLANGGRYAGLTYLPVASLRMRLGAQLKDDRLDRFSFDPLAQSYGVPAGYGTGQSQSLLAGVAWDFGARAGIGLDEIITSQNGLADGGRRLDRLAQTGRLSSAALNVSAHMNFGGGWVTTAAYTNGLTQLDQKSGPSAVLDSHSYSIAIAKHGLFGDDAVGFSFSRPSAGLLDNSFEMVAASGDLPPVFVPGNLQNRAPETDLQLGYVTSFLDGALALQTNAAYQMNYQGQTGATSLAVLSRAKIKF